MNTLIEKARQQLGSQAPHPLRACWLARTALEDVITELLSIKGVLADRASERARLSCLESVYAEDRTVAHRAEYAWNRLSDACHQHAYQLAPTYPEVMHLVDLVDELGRLAERRHTEAT